MSYDLRVVTTLQPKTTAVTEFLAKRRGRYSVDGILKAGSGNLAVSTEKRGHSVPVFMIDGPFKIEVKDVDDALVGLLLGPQWLTEISVPTATSQADFKLARSLGVQLAKSFQGAIFDPQDDAVVWPKRRPRLYKTPQTADSIDVVNLRWCLPYSQRGLRTAQSFVELSRKHLYECLPRRYGLFEPFQGKVENGDFTGFFSLWDEAALNPYGDTLSFSCVAPCFGGSVSFSDPRDDMPRNEGAQKIVELQIDIDRRAMREPVWLESVVSLFTTVSRELGSFYSIGYVERGIKAKGRNLYFTSSSEIYPLPRHNRWLGLPPVPAWLIWMGPPYSEAVYSVCKSQITEQYDEGFLIRRTIEPSDIEKSASGFPVFPKNLQAKLSEHTLSGQLASSSGASVLQSDDRMTDKTADLILPLE